MFGGFKDGARSFYGLLYRASFFLVFWERGRGGKGKGKDGFALARSCLQEASDQHGERVMIIYVRQQSL